MGKLIQFRHQYDERLLKGTFEAFTKPSMTEPDNSLSIPEIIAKFTRGIPAEVRQYQWTDGVSVPEEGYIPDDGTLESVLEIHQEAPQSEPQAPAETASASALKEPESAPAPAGA